MDQKRPRKRARNKGGRPSKLTPEVMGVIEAALSAGMGRRESAAIAGVNKATLYRWLERGQAARDANRTAVHTALLGFVEQAEVAALFDALVVIREGGETWPVAARWLETRYPRDFGRRRPAPPDDPAPRVRIDRYQV